MGRPARLVVESEANKAMLASLDVSVCRPQACVLHQVSLDLAKTR